MLTSDGATRIAEILAGQFADARIVVANGSQEASAALDQAPSSQDGRLTFQATFGEQEANFDWSETRIVAADGTVLDVDRADGGRKAPGTEWTLTAEVDLSPAEA